MNLVRSITRFVPRCSRFQEPSAQEVSVDLIRSAERYFIKTPWAMLDAPHGKDTDDSQLSASLRPCFATAGEAEDWARLHSPHWFDKRNDVVRCRLHDAIRWHGDFSGPIRLADAMRISEDRLRGIVNGKYLATAKESRLAKEWKGGAA